MKGMPWSWGQLQETPEYVRRFCWDFQCLEAEHQHAENERLERIAAQH